MERRANVDGRENFETLLEALARRIQPLCAHFDPAELEQLFVRMIRVQLRFERETAVPPAS